jgi:hypothetical protein
MKYHHHTQHPFSDELRRRLHCERLERRAAAAHAFIGKVIYSSLACWVFLALSAVLDGGLT